MANGDKEPMSEMATALQSSVATLEPMMPEQRFRLLATLVILYDAQHEVTRRIRDVDRLVRYGG